MTKDCSVCKHFDVFHTSRACHDCKPWKSSTDQMSRANGKRGRGMTREEAIKVIESLKQLKDGGVFVNLNEALDMAIEALKDRPHGEWKHTITWQPYCSNCEYVFGEDEEFSPFWKYCPNCGAIMKGGAE